MVAICPLRHAKTPRRMERAAFLNTITCRCYFKHRITFCSRAAVSGFVLRVENAKQKKKGLLRLCGTNTAHAAHIACCDLPVRSDPPAARLIKTHYRPKLLDLRWIYSNELNKPQLQQKTNNICMKNISEPVICNEQAGMTEANVQSEQTACARMGPVQGQTRQRSHHAFHILQFPWRSSIAWYHSFWTSSLSAAMAKLSLRV